ncbi:YceH family protein [Uliginosibacterium sp. H3]|uniref:YceH family protein n=1 Tax=Uliginosibacterium silvisoli TaxID=3114758 RepID=A0ABU6JXU1_9RHOO|nr:YceH family protein [Uliginosibacterium sp. H3]
MPLLQLTPTEARVLAVLAEKEKTVPDSYPMSLNAIITGCNQKTSRDPVMEVSESEALQAIDALKSHTLILETFGNRVTRYSHNVGRVLNLPTPAAAIVVTLMLRGHQTSAELRANSERLYRFADVSSIEAFLEELAARADGALVKLMPRTPGAREARWAHLLSGEPVASAHAPTAAPEGGLAARVAALEEQVASLSAQLARVTSELGLVAGE